MSEMLFTGVSFFFYFIALTKERNKVKCLCMLEMVYLHSCVFL